MYHVTKFLFIYLSFKPGFHMIATIAEKKKFSDRSDHMETGLYFSLLLSCPFPSKPVYKFGFRSSVQKNGLPGEGRHEGLVPRNDVLTTGFIRFSLPRTLARIFFVPRLLPPPPPPPSQKPRRRCESRRLIICVFRSDSIIRVIL